MTDVLEPALPWDILRDIAFTCPHDTCTTLMHTCTFFLHEAAASILSQELRLSHESTTVAFLKFLHGGKKPRYPCVRHLALRFNPNFFSPPLSPESEGALAGAIALMTQLVIVEIKEDTIAKWPALGDAIAFLSSLREIIVLEAGPRSLQHFLSLQSANLRSIKIEISQHESERAPWLSAHPVQLFRRWKSTLTELDYSLYAHPAYDVSSCYPEVYPMMHTLSICHRGRVDPTPYIRAFPNLAHLHVDSRSQLNKDVHEYRILNIRSQREVHCLGPASPHLGWRGPIRFKGSLVDLYALALNCHISHLKIVGFINDTVHLPMLSEVLADTRPLHLNISGPPEILHHPTTSLSSIFQTQGASRLESLVISYRVDWRTPYEDVASALSSLATALAMLPGPFRRLQMDMDHRADTHQSDRGSSSAVGSPEHRLTIALDNSDVKTIVQVFVETIPTLESACVRFWDVDKMKVDSATFVRQLGDVVIIDTSEDHVWSCLSDDGY
ncbi:hypothetical protein C8Q74DRAFT_1371292 [Fomes fomentarius]|nr:hypothetical protein C8Q74DRAFT_1371292 [Fomes fomentarius]